MAIKKLTYKLTGTRPLLMHNGHLANPISVHAKAIKEITGKRQKTDADHIEIARREWLGGLYRDAKGRVCVTEDMMLGMLQEAAGIHRKRKNARRVLCSEPTFPVEYKGPKDPDELWSIDAFRDMRLAVVNRARVVRTRPRFVDWSLVVSFLVNTEDLDERDVDKIVRDAGDLIGLGDFRPRFGTFTVDRA